MGNEHPVTIAIIRRIRQDAVDTFERAIQDWIPKAVTFPGYQGALILRPPTGGDEYGAVLRFQSAAAWQSFQQWPEYVEWLESLRPLLLESPRIQELHGLEAWFSNSGSSSPPRWKMAVITWIGVNIAAYSLTFVVKPLTANWPFLLDFVTFNGAVVIGLTWIVMPLLTRLAWGWLAGTSPNDRRPI